MDLPEVRDDNSELHTALIRVVEVGHAGSFDTDDKKKQLRTGSENWEDLIQSREEIFQQKTPQNERATKLASSVIVQQSAAKEFDSPTKQGPMSPQSEEGLLRTSARRSDSY